MAAIPQVFDQPGALFVLLPAGKKFPPIEKGWQLPENAHSYAEACQHRGNVGILAAGGCGGLDQDMPEAFQGLKLGATTSWETRPGRLGFWLQWADNPAEVLPKYGFKEDQAQIYLYKEGAKVGEIKLQRSYQAIPPSWKTLEDGTRADYKLLDSSPPSEISLEKLLQDLQKLGITFSEKGKEREKPQLEANAQKLEDMARGGKARRAESEESRERKYADAALQGEVLRLAGTARGSRNNQLNLSAFALGQFVAAGLLSEMEVIRALSKAATYVGLTPEEIEATIRSGLEAGARHPREIPDSKAGVGDPGRQDGGRGKEKVPSLGLEEIEVGFKADPDSITTPGALAGLRRLSPFKLAGFFKKLGINGDQKKILLDLLNAEESTPEEPKEDPAILAEAERILGDGKAFEYILEVWQKRHHGDENLGKGLFLSTGAQSCISSKGVHVHACGPRGSGKSDGAEKASEAMPGSHLLVGSASPKALYYLGERLPAGAVVYLDDIGWNDQAAQMFKTCTTFYRTGATHTVVVDQEIRQFKTAPRIIFWLTTADDQTDEQIRDRLLRIDVTETPKHTAEVIDFIFKQRKSGAAAFDPHEIEVCRAIIHLLKQVFVDVVIPFTDSIRFEGDPRGATIFADLVSAFAVWRYRIRERNSNGAVIACYEDYKDAETFFNAIKGHGDTKYTPRELRVLQAIKDLHGVATREMVMAKTRLSKGDLSDILNGRSRDGQAKYGLFHKCAALTEDEEGTSTQLDDSKKTRTSIKKKILRLPADYDTLSAYGKAVYLADETMIKRTCSASSEQFGTGSEIKNEFGKDVVRKFVEYNIIRERRTPEHHPLSPVDTKKIFFVSPGPKMPNLPNLEPSDSGSPFRTKTVPTPNHPNPSIKEQKLRAEQERQAREEHFSQKAEQHSNIDQNKRITTQSNIDEDIHVTGRLSFKEKRTRNTNSGKCGTEAGQHVCVVCGEDLTGKGQLQKNGLYYCARPGCGYPGREGA